MKPNKLRESGAVFNGFTDGHGRRKPFLDESALKALRLKLGAEYQVYYTLTHGALGEGGALLPTEMNELRVIVQTASRNSPRTMGDAIEFAQRLSRGTCRILTLPSADIEAVKQNRDWWFLLEYIGVSHISLDVWGDIMDDSFDFHLSRLVVEARRAAMTSGRTTLEEVKQILRETLDDAGVEVGEIAPKAPEDSKLVFELICYSLLAKRWASVDIFLSAIPVLMKQAPLDYFSATDMSAWKNEGAGFSQLLYESLAIPSAASWDMARKTAQIFEEAQEVMRIRRFFEDLSAFIPKVRAWMKTVD